jgi:hypothetical protein
VLTGVYHQFETSVYGYPALCVPAISGLSAPANVYPDAGAVGIVMYMHPSSYAGPVASQLSETTMLPIMTPEGLSYGGQVVTYGPHTLPRVVIEGFMDTPCSRVGEYLTPQLIDTSGIRYTYAEVITMMLEGRANYLVGGGWERLDPLWFRDPWGRLYLAPRILDFTSNYVEGIPERNQFTLTLKI